MSEVSSGSQPRVTVAHVSSDSSGRHIPVNFGATLKLVPLGPLGAMPEYPHITVYRECIARKLVGAELREVRLGNPFLLRSVEPALEDFRDLPVREVRTIGKRLVLAFDEELFLVVHLMIAGRLHWRGVGAKLGSKSTLAGFDFDAGCLVLTEAGSTRRASLMAIQGEAALAELDPGGVNVFDVSTDEFRQAMTRSNHTLKRALTDPHILSGIGNAFSDEILHSARLSPVRLTDKLDDDDWERLHQVCQRVLNIWADRIRAEAKDDWPKEVSAFHPEMAVHGKFGEPCPVCRSPVQRIVYATRETNYCAGCQTEGKLLADRALSRLLKSDWPRRLEELEERR